MLVQAFIVFVVVVVWQTLWGQHFDAWGYDLDEFSEFVRYVTLQPWCDLPLG